MPTRTTKRRNRTSAGKTPRRGNHILLVISAAIATILIIILTGGGTGWLTGSLVNPPDAVMYLNCPDSGAKGAELPCTVTTKNVGKTFFTGLIVTLSLLDFKFVNSSVACEEQKNGDVICSRKSIGAVEPGKQDEFTVTVSVSTACKEEAYLAASAKIGQRESNTNNNTKVKKVTCT